MKRKNYFDIEVLTDFDREFKDVFITADRPIISIQTYDSFTNKYFLFIQKEGFEVSEKLKRIKGVNDTIIEYHELRFDNESDLIIEFVKYLRKYDFDIHSGFNIVGFDFPYLIRRMKNIKINYNLLSTLDVVYFIEKMQQVDIKGSIILDIQTMILSFVGKQKEGMSLDLLSMKFLGVGKLTVDARKMLGWYETDIDQFIKYSMIDVQLCIMLDKKLGLIEMANSIIEFSCTIPQYVYKSGKCVESYIFATRNDNRIFDDNIDVDVSGIEGAKVFENQKRLIYQYGAVIDFKRLYPNIIRSFNISPETIFMYDEKIYNEKEYILLPSKKYMTLRNKLGIFPEKVEGLFKIRDLYEKKMKETDKNSDIYDAIKRQRQNAKDRVNTISGLFDSKYSRWKCIAGADGIRGSGVYLLNLISDTAENLGYMRLYGDTDSIFILSKIQYIDGSKEEILRVKEEFEKLVIDINSAIDKKLNMKHYIEVDLEKIFDVYASVGTKKKYFMHKVWENGFVDQMYSAGFELKRSDSSDYSYKVQTDLFTAISHKKSKSEIESLCRNFVKEFKNTEIMKIAMPKSIKPFSSYKVTNPWVEGSLYSNKYLNTNFSSGSKPRLLYMDENFDPVSIPKTNCICIDIDTDISPFKYKDDEGNEQIAIDWNKMIEKNIIDKIDDILNILDIEIDYIKRGRRTNNLLRYLNQREINNEDKVKNKPIINNILEIEIEELGDVENE